MDDEDLPLLGEPLAVELANTWYGADDQAVDYLGEPGLAARWVAHHFGNGVEPAGPDLREVRGAVRALLAADAAGLPLDPCAVQVINGHAARASARVALVIVGGAPTLQASLCGDPAALAAASCVQVLAGPDPVKRCEGPGCSMFFVQTHGRRRFCHDGCSHRQRQARYRRSQR